MAIVTGVFAFFDTAAIELLAQRDRGAVHAQNDVSDLQARLFGRRARQQRGDVSDANRAARRCRRFRTASAARRDLDGELLAVAQDADLGFASRARADGDEELLPRVDVAAGDADDAIAALDAGAAPPASPASTCPTTGGLD